MRIFISYSSSDRNYALELSARIRSAGHDAFLDLDELPSGRGYDKRIINEIKKSHSFIFLASEDSLKETSYALAELKLAEKYRPNASLFLMPVRLSKSVSTSNFPPYCKSVCILDAEGEWIPEVIDAAISNRKARIRKTFSKVIASVGLTALFVFVLFFSDIVRVAADVLETVDQWKNRKDKKVVSQIETDTIIDVERLVRQLGSRYGSDYVITVFDIEGVLLTPDTPIGSDTWYYWQKLLRGENECDVRLVRDPFEAMVLIRTLTKWRPTESGVSAMMKSLLEDGQNLLGITGSGPDFRLSYFRELKRNDIDFSKINSKSKRDKYTFVGDSLVRIALFEDGVIFGAGQKKGDLFLQYLEDSKFPSSPKALVVVDSKLSNLHNFQEAVVGTDISLYLFRYSGMDLNVAEFDSELAVQSLTELRDAMPGLSSAFGGNSILGERWEAIFAPGCADLAGHNVTSEKTGN